MYGKRHIKAERTSSTQPLDIVGLTTVCPSCLNEQQFDLPRRRKGERLNRDRLEAWQNGEFVQDAFPDLNADQRELLITGTCSKCWDKMFAEVEDDYDLTDGDVLDDLD